MNANQLLSRRAVFLSIAVVLAAAGVPIAGWLKRDWDDRTLLIAGDRTDAAAVSRWFSAHAESRSEEELYDLIESFASRVASVKEADGHVFRRDPQVAEPVYAAAIRACPASRLRALEPLLASASGHGCLGAVQAALARGVPVDCRDRTGMTPLMHAADNSEAEVVRYLLSRGADPSLTAEDFRGYPVTPLSLAERSTPHWQPEPWDHHRIEETAQLIRAALQRRPSGATAR